MRISLFAASQEGSQFVRADSASSAVHSGKGAEETGKFRPGEMIIEHVVDAYEWHILSAGNFHLTIPLPVLLYTEGKFYSFLSNRLHEGSYYKGFVIASAGPHKGKIITVKEAITGKPGPTIIDLSLTKTVLAIILSGLFLILIFTTVAAKYKRNPNVAPTGLQNMIEPLIVFIRDDVAKSSIGKNYERYLPFLLTIFFFIFFNNILGIIPIFPGGANVTGNIAVTGVLAIFTFVITTFSANRHYWIDIINTPGVPWWLKLPVPLMPIVEIIGIITKPFVLMVRLFANMTAGHIIILGFISIIFIFGKISMALGIGVGIPTLLFMIFMDLLELLVAFIQAYVFTLLSALYFGLALAEPDHHAEI